MGFVMVANHSSYEYYLEHHKLPYGSFYSHRYSEPLVDYSCYFLKPSNNERTLERTLSLSDGCFHSRKESNPLTPASAGAFSKSPRPLLQPHHF